MEGAYGERRWAKKLAVVVSNPLVVRDITGALARGAFDAAWRMAHTTSRSPDLGAEKIVSRKYRCLWICNPKVASRSIMSALLCVDPDVEIIQEKRISDVHATYPEVRDYYSFAFIRHPFGRALSFYRELHFAHEYYDEEQRGKKEEKRRKFFDRVYGLTETDGFDDFCRWLNTHYGSDAFAERHFLSQHLQIRLDGVTLPDFIGHFENLETDWHRVTTHLGMPASVLPLLNTIAGWQTTPEALKTVRTAADAYLTDRNKALLRTRYAEDFKLGGYR